MNFDRCADFVICIEATSNMKCLSGKINEMLKKIIEDYREWMISNEWGLDQLRDPLI